MGKRDDLIAKYADDLKNKCKVTPDMDLLAKVTIGCGPAIYDNDAQTVAASQSDELERIKNNFLIKKLGLSDADGLDDAIAAVEDEFAPSESGAGAALDADLELETELAGGRAEATLPEEQTTVAEGE